MLTYLQHSIDQSIKELLLRSAKKGEFNSFKGGLIYKGEFKDKLIAVMGEDALGGILL